MFELKKWNMVMSGVYVMAQGYCFGNPKFSEGFYIHTSVIMKTKVDMEKGYIICITHSGSEYYLDFAEFDIRCREETKAVMEYLDIPLDVADMCISKTIEKEQQLIKKLDKTMEKGDLFLSLIGVNACSAYFMYDSLVKMYIGYHTGMFQDSVLIRDLESYKADFRYFPYVASIAPYHTSDAVNRIIIYNDGEEIMFEGSGKEILLKKGVDTIIERQYLQKEGLFSPDCTGSAPLADALLRACMERGDN